MSVQSGEKDHLSADPTGKSVNTAEMSFLANAVLLTSCLHRLVVAFDSLPLWVGSWDGGSQSLEEFPSQ